MGKVITGITMSLDGFVAGPNDSPEQGLGEGGDKLFTWYFNGEVEVPMPNGMVLKVSPESAKLLKEDFSTGGAMVAGRRMFDIARAWGGNPPGSPCFILTHHPPQEWVKEGSPFIFVTDGIESAIRQAKQAAGDKDVGISSASINQQCLKAGLLDELHLYVVPLLLGAGIRLFDHLGGTPIELESTKVVAAPGVTHMYFRVVK
jgi:dihydrofolate reductase